MLKILKILMMKKRKKKKQKKRKKPTMKISKLKINLQKAKMIRIKAESSL